MCVCVRALCFCLWYNVCFCCVSFCGMICALLFLLCCFVICILWYDLHFFGARFRGRICVLFCFLVVFTSK